jgi:CelD/BcsL family acetyltransferase involved in cellulose biosynthesis
LLEGLRVRVLRTLAELEGFEAAWDSLWREDARATPFQSAAWLLPWSMHFAGSDLRVAVVSTGERVLALLPFYVHLDPDSGERRLLPLGIGTSDYLDGLFAPECEVSHVQRGLETLLEESGWDRLIVEQLRPESPLLQAIERWGCCEVDRHAGAACSRMPALRVGELSKNLRRNVLRCESRAARRGPLDVVRSDSAASSSVFESLVAFHTARWNARGGPGVLCDPSVLAWHRRAIPRLATQGLLHLSSLRSNGQPIAVIYGLVDPPVRSCRTLYAYLQGFSLEHAELSPGTLHLALAAEQARNEGIAFIDMLRGHETYKKLWKPEERPTFGVSYRKTLAIDAGPAVPNHAARAAQER